MIANAPVLLSLYRGWWYPSSEFQLSEIMEKHATLASQGVKIYAGSVDCPEESSTLEEHVGDKITILCNLSTELLDKNGMHDERGALD